MNKELSEALDYYLQGRINTCVSGLMSRIDRLEEVASRQQAHIAMLTEGLNAVSKNLADAKAQIKAITQRGNV